MYEQLVQVMELEGYSRPTYNKFVHSATTRLAVVDVIDKLTFYEFLLRLKCRNYSRDRDHAYWSVSYHEANTSCGQPEYKIWSVYILRGLL